jgi:hypothetical protein
VAGPLLAARVISLRDYALPMRAQLRTIVAAIVIVVIVAAGIAEPPGLAEGIGYVAVVLVMILVILRERGLIK